MSLEAARKEVPPSAQAMRDAYEGLFQRTLVGLGVAAPPVVTAVFSGDGGACAMRRPGVRSSPLAGTSWIRPEEELAR